MRLLDIHKFQLCSFEDERKAPPYAILSHTWGENEVTFDEITGPRLSEDVASQGVKKILMFTEQAKKAGYDYVWVDTCTLSARDLTLTAELATKPNLGCIQKSSSVSITLNPALTRKSMKVVQKVCSVLCVPQRRSAPPVLLAHSCRSII